MYCTLHNALQIASQTPVMPPRKRKRAAPTADSSDPRKNTQSEVSRRSESHQNEAEDATDMQQVSCLRRFYDKLAVDGPD